jgi:hypothetical protein
VTTQVALLGEISPNVRGIAIDWNNTDIHLRAIFDGEPNEDDIDSMECAGTEIIASFPEHEIRVELIRKDTPLLIEENRLKAWVYRRKE